MGTSTRYQSLRNGHSKLLLEHRKLEELVELLTDVPTREVSVILAHFRQSKDSTSALALAQQTLARVNTHSEQSHANVTAVYSCRLPSFHCPCSVVHRLSMNTWQRLFDTYWKHYSADLPFLHASTFLDICYQYGRHEKSCDNKSRCCVRCDPSLQRYTPLLLAFLALTSRHHPDLLPTDELGESIASDHLALTDSFFASKIGRKYTTATSVNGRRESSYCRSSA